MDGIENKSSLRQGFVGHVKDVVEYERFLKMGEAREQPEGEGAGEAAIFAGGLRILKETAGEMRGGHAMSHIVCPADFEHRNPSGFLREWRRAPYFPRSFL